MTIHVLAASITIAVVAFGCSTTLKENEHEVWNGNQTFEDDTLISPSPLDDGLARYVCAETWSQTRPGDRDIAYAHMAGLTTHYVHHDTLLAAHPDFETVDGDTPSQFEVRLTADALTNPLVALGHECGHVIELALGVYDPAHTDPEVWNDDDGIVARVKRRIVDLEL